MTLLNLLLVAIVQGITEFLPVSSSGHLVLLPALTGMRDQGLAIDVAVHVGTLGAVIVYFWPDVRNLLGGIPQLLRGRVESQGAWLALCLLISTIPVAVAGLILQVTGLIEALRSVAVIGWSTLIFGILLYFVDQNAPAERRAERWSMRDATIMGFWQVIALIPGASRSGVTITGGRYLGYRRDDAARLSMLMSIPTILCSGALLSVDAIADASPGFVRDASIAAAFAFVAALLALKLMFMLLRSTSFTPYVLYRIALGLGLLAYSYF